MTTIRETARAKINLDLRVCRRREDGYHDLDSLVAFTDLGDELIFKDAASLALAIEGPFAQDLVDEENNLVLEAVRRLAALLFRSPDVHITLIKRLPVASGIGGGSADAAAALRGMVRFWNLPMTAGDLLPHARDLGADVAVCLGSSAVRMTGIGTCLAPIGLPAPLSILLVNPGTPIETPGVFKRLGYMSGERTGGVPTDDASSFRQALQASTNDLETSARGIAPVINDVLSAIARQAGCDLARMSGSGATCFGLFRDSGSLDGAKDRLRADHPDWWIASSVCR